MHCSGVVLRMPWQRQNAWTMIIGALGLREETTMRICRGITAIELMVAIGVLSVLVILAAPSISSTLERQRLIGATHALLSAMHLARSEAIKRNQRVALCPSSDGIHCREDGDWSHGWIWFLDTGVTGERSTDDPLLGRESLGQAGKLGITGNQPVRDYVAYTPRGTTRRTNGALQMGSFTLCAGGQGRRVIVSSVGRPRSEAFQSCQGSDD